MYTRHLLIIVALVAVIFTACSTTPSHKIVSEQLNPDWQVTKLRNMAIVSVDGDRAFRISSESVFADRVTLPAFDVITTYDRIPDLVVLEREDTAIEALRSIDSDAVMTITLLSSNKEYGHEDYWSTYGWMWLLGADNRQAHRIATLKDTSDYYGQGNFKLDISLWDPKTLTLIWSATTDSYSIDRASEGVTILSDFVTRTLTERGFL